MRTPLHIALRYLFAKKTHNVINIISIISAAGIAIGSMALILILSVYNGFDNSIKKIYEGYKADFLIAPTLGKTIEITPEQISKLNALEGVSQLSKVIEEDVFVRYGNREEIATIRGIDTSYLKHNHINGNLIEGEASLSLGEIGYAIVGQQLARSLGLRVRFITPIELYFPKTDSNISITNPLESLNSLSLYPKGIVKTDGEDNPNIIYAGSNVVKKLLQKGDNEVSYIEVYTKDDVKKQLEEIFPLCSVKNKEQQNATLYRMMKAEKFAVYLILFFVIAIISVNIFSSLSMLVTDKKEDIETFLSLGATKELVQKIFHLHGFLISLFGCALGTAVGTALAIIQKTTGIISIPGNYLITAYPVDIQFADIAITFLGVCSVGYLISWLPLRNFFKN